jgi:hypothetical protein
VKRFSGRLRAEYLLPIVCVAAAACVAAAEFSTIFEFNQGTSGEPLKTIEAADRHYYSLFVLAVFAVIATAIAVMTGSRPAAMAVAVAGGLALLIFLLVDLPDVNREGDIGDESVIFFASKAEPANGFWLELVGTVTLAVAGGALATLRPDQLQLLAPRRFRRAAEPGAPEPAARTGGARPPLEAEPAPGQAEGGGPAAGLSAGSRAGAGRRERAR